MCVYVCVCMYMRGDVCWIKLKTKGMMMLFFGLVNMFCSSDSLLLLFLMI